MAGGDRPRLPSTAYVRLEPVDVLVVGAGPAGLTLALPGLPGTARDVRVVERRRTAFRPSRAMILHPSTLECLCPLGVSDALLARAAKSAQIVCVHLDSPRADCSSFDSLALAQQPVRPSGASPAVGRGGDPCRSLWPSDGVEVEHGVELVGLQRPREPSR